MFTLSLLFWAVMLVMMLCMAPFAALGGLYFGAKKIFLKFRRRAADILRPKDVVRARNTEPQSDLVATFVDYELLLVSGKETTAARSALISELAHVEQELEEHRILCAEIRKLRVEDERPRRRDAILSTRRRAVARRQREQDEQKEGQE
jgi:hypothetical protein